METQFSPSRDEFRRLAQQGNVIPVFADWIADSETPVSAFHKIDRGGHSFLFESTEKNDVTGRFSFVGTDPKAIFRSRDGLITITENDEARQVQSESDPLLHLRELMAKYRFVRRADLPHFVGGAVGFVGYDAVRYFEPTVPVAERDELGLPETVFIILETVIIFDHRLRILRVLSNAFLPTGAEADVAYDHARDKIRALLACLRAPANLPPIALAALTPPRSQKNGMSQGNFERLVVLAQEHIRRGDIFQIVLSRRLEVEFACEPLALYRCLRFVNPSPYMFCLKFGSEFSLVGSSPELHVRVMDRRVELRPIAGTRPRGRNVEEDERNAADLLADAKERAEHVMLVDLARNDLGKIAEFGSVRLSETMGIERYSHVMHIVSHVEAQLRNDRDAYDVLRATFPAGTVSGAPKVRAMQLISRLEETRRGCYAGVVGYIGFDGNLDSCIALRSVVLKGSTAFLQAGAGIVADSIPWREYEETENKAAAVMQAIAMASPGLDSPH